MVGCSCLPIVFSLSLFWSVWQNLSRMHWYRSAVIPLLLSAVCLCIISCASFLHLYSFHRHSTVFFLDFFFLCSAACSLCFLGLPGICILWWTLWGSDHKIFSSLLTTFTSNLESILDLLCSHENCFSSQGKWFSLHQQHFFSFFCVRMHWQTDSLWYHSSLACSLLHELTARGRKCVHWQKTPAQSKQKRCELDQMAQGQKQFKLIW